MAGEAPSSEDEDEDPEMSDDEDADDEAQVCTFNAYPSSLAG